MPSDVFCQAETGLFDVIRCYTGECPLPKNKLQYLREALRKTLTFEFIEKPSMFKEARGRMEAEIQRHTGDAHPIFVSYLESEVSSIVDELTAIVERGSYGQDLFRKASGILAGSFRRKSGKRIVGEKTPSNVFCLPMICAMARCFITVREPFAAIRSMTVRGGGDGPEVWGFSSEFGASLGQYLQYLRQVRRASDCRLIRYEDLVAAPDKVVAEALEEIGCPVDESQKSAVQAVVHRHSVKTPDELGFTPIQKSIVAAVLREDLKAIGYELTFRPAPVEGEQMIKLFGFKIPPKDWTFGENAAIFVISERKRRKMAVKLWSQFPVPREVDLSIRIDGRSAERITVGARATESAVELDLNHRGHEFDGGYVGHLVEFKSSFWHRPVSVDRLSADTQATSFMITSIDLR